jgi:hypothetical protein
MRSAAECKANDRKIKLMRLLQLDEPMIMAAIYRTDLELADAIEFAGNIIAEKRRLIGDVKRKTKAPK